MKKLWYTLIYLESNSERVRVREKSKRGIKEKVKAILKES